MKEKEDLILASNNKHKIKEFNEILGKQFNILSLEDVGFYDDIVEDGETFLDNALIKARTISEFLKNKGVFSSVIAEDSGLCVEALDGNPGVYSARYAVDHDHIANRHKVLDDMKDKENRKAYFECMIVKVEPDGNYNSFEGRTYGEILTEERGESGFAYDPIFFSPELKKSFGEATEDEKNSVSHRGRAIEKLVKSL